MDADGAKLLNKLVGCLTKGGNTYNVSFWRKDSPSRQVLMKGKLILEEAIQPE